MELTFCSDVSAADWISASDLPWSRLVTFGPEGFADYARLRFLPDPAYAGQRESDVDRDDVRPERVQLPMLFEVLAAQTFTPDDCYFCLWEGFGTINAFPPSVLGGPRVVVPGRTYLLFHGPLSTANEWPVAERRPLAYWPPAFVWPADHAWCVAFDVDPHWAGIGADAMTVDQLMRDPRFDVVRADPSKKQPRFD